MAVTTPWSLQDPNESENFEPKPALGSAITAGAQGAGVGLFFATIQNALGSHGHGAAGVFTRYGATIGTLAAMGATFAAAEAVTANVREKDDSINGAAGGCAAGFLAGIKARSLPVALGSCAVLAAAVGTYDYAGKSLLGARENLTPEERRARFFKQRPVTIPDAE